MHVLTIYAHSNPKSFCHAVLDQFTAGLREAGHSIEVVDLYAIGFDPVHRQRDTPSWLTESIPDDLLDRMHLRESLLEGAGGPLRRFAMKRLSATATLAASFGCCENVFSRRTCSCSSRRWREPRHWRSLHPSIS